MVRWLVAVPGAVGRTSLEWTGDAGRAAIFFARAIIRAPALPLRVRQVVEHVHFIGNRSLSVILLTAAFTGMVLILQAYTALVRFGSELYIGPLVSLSLIRELGPVLAALMVTARAGSAIAATLGTMRVTEQIDALEAMAVDPIQYLVSPRLVAALLTVPALVALFDVAGIGVAWFFGVTVLGIDGGGFMGSVRDAVDFSDVLNGFWKSLVFAALIAGVATYQGYSATQGAQGVGRATTRAVVVSSVLILASDYVMTALLF
jgi:phospholipid/cholesterol/gamma-HCH transport system permease protein